MKGGDTERNMETAIRASLDEVPLPDVVHHLICMLFLELYPSNQSETGLSFSKHFEPPMALAVLVRPPLTTSASFGLGAVLGVFAPAKAQAPRLASARHGVTGVVLDRLGGRLVV